MSEPARTMRLVIQGHDLPGRTCGRYADVHVGVQVRRAAVGLVPGDAPSAEWVVDLTVVDGDLRGPAVHGGRGERFVYLTWGTGSGESFVMFRRAKLMLADLVPTRAEAVARVHLTDEQGLPRCARLQPPAVEWVA